jgi:hypothetical protein
MSDDKERPDPWSQPQKQAILIAGPETYAKLIEELRVTGREDLKPFIFMHRSIPEGKVLHIDPALFEKKLEELGLEMPKPAPKVEPKTEPAKRILVVGNGFMERLKN